ncbi:hypothetical protein C7E19_24685, partial [Stenotrophomonas maltophilia]
RCCRSAQIAMESGWMDAAAIEVAYETMRARCMASGGGCRRPPTLQSLQEVMAPLAPLLPLGADRDGVGLDGCGCHRSGLRNDARALHG